MMLLGVRITFWMRFLNAFLIFYVALLVFASHEAGLASTGHQAMKSISTSVHECVKEF